MKFLNIFFQVTICSSGTHFQCQKGSYCGPRFCGPLRKITALSFKCLPQCNNGWSCYSSTESCNFLIHWLDQWCGTQGKTYCLGTGMEISKKEDYRTMSNHAQFLERHPIIHSSAPFPGMEHPGKGAEYCVLCMVLTLCDYWASRCSRELNQQAGRTAFKYPSR